MILKGITWGHSRGISPLQAASQRFKELFNIEVNWRQRTLQEFADYPIEKLTETYDLLIIDHPWVGFASNHNYVLPLDEYLPTEFLANQKENQVGKSHDSYFYGGHQWAFAIDAATPVSSYRLDLFKEFEVLLPHTWQDVLELAKKGKVAAPAIPIDLLMTFYMFCQALRKEPFQNYEEIINEETGIQALEVMKEFYSLLPKKCFEANPIRIAEWMSSTNEFWYCPFAYGYSNYSRDGYAKYLLHYGNLVEFSSGNFLKSTLGGTGLAVSFSSKFKEEAVQFAQFIMSENYQSTEYVLNGGQPGHRKAWENKLANKVCHHFFENTLQSLDNSYMRPRYSGYLYFQDHAGNPLQDYLLGNKDAETALNEMNLIYRESLKLGEHE